MTTRLDIAASAICFVGLLGGCAPSSTPDGGVAIRVLVDGELVPGLPALAPGRLRPLAELLPEDLRDPKKWRQVEARSYDGLFLRIPDPTVTYPEHEILVACTEDGRIGIGVYPPDVPREEGGWPPLSLVGVAELHVRTAAPERAASQGEPLVVERPGAEPTHLTRARLDELTRLTPGEASSRGRGMRRQWGWHLGDVLALAVPLEDVGSVRVHGKDGVLEVEAELLRARELPLPLLKGNRRGQWILKIWEPGDPRPTVGRQMRGIVRVEVVLRARESRD
ncbi:MAG: hypothetical protein O7B99_00460 [Planctomycetota bacterium]|nr:hypothetical protein [Planctomycetota bacterium]